ncbi:MAG: hypothetical protein ACJ71Q_11200 [Terriglobales bacterium]
MIREVTLISSDGMIRTEIPTGQSEVIPGVLWGDPWVVFTPAYWLAQAKIAQFDGHVKSPYRSQFGIVEELGFCLLGGYGIKAEVAEAAFRRCQQAGLFSNRESRQERWRAMLLEPLQIGSRSVRYRFPNQKARYLAAAMTYFTNHELPLRSGTALRNALLNVPGVGYKIASWVARNVLDTDDVAILDIHLIRAGLLCGLFSSSNRVDKHYLQMECRYLDFCRQLKIRAAVLDCLIWDHMRAAGSLPLDLLGDRQRIPNQERLPVQP